MPGKFISTVIGHLGFHFIFLLGLVLCHGGEKTSPPKLAVILVIDQMRGDFFEHFEPNLGEGGFKRLKQEGVVYQQHRLSHANTETGPGHSVILTGVSPQVSGMVKNNWYNHKGEKIYCVLGEPSSQTLPPGSGPPRGPELLQAPTLGDILKDKFPGSKVFSISSKDRAAVLLGGKRADGAIWLNKETGEMVTSAYYMNEIPGWLKKWNHKNPSPPNPSPLQFKIPGQVPRELSLIKDLIQREKLGQGHSMDMLAWSISTPDYIGHQYGWESMEVRETFREVDSVMADLLLFLDETLGTQNYHVMLTSDHGVRHTVEHIRSRMKKEAAEKAGYLRISEGKMVLDFVNQWEHPKAGSLKMDMERAYLLIRPRVNDIYLHKPLADSLGIPLEDLKTGLRKFLKKQPWVAETWDPAEKSSETPFARAARAGYHPGRSGDLMYSLVAGANTEGPLGQHGYFGEDCNHIPLIIRAPGFAPNSIARPTRDVDVAPTLAALWGLPPLRLTGGKALVEFSRK